MFQFTIYVFAIALTQVGCDCDCRFKIQMRNLMRRIETHDHNFNLTARKAARAPLSLIGRDSTIVFLAETRPRIQRDIRFGSFNFVSEIYNTLSNLGSILLSS
jgi:hypothetical protein